MTPERLRLLDTSNEPFNDNEIAQGFHRCPEWDFLVIGPDDPEWEYCSCEIKYSYDK